jgi:hypothetical protein
LEGRLLNRAWLLLDCWLLHRTGLLLNCWLLDRAWLLLEGGLLLLEGGLLSRRRLRLVLLLRVLLGWLDWLLSWLWLRLLGSKKEKCVIICECAMHSPDICEGGEYVKNNFFTCSRKGLIRETKLCENLHELWREKKYVENFQRNNKKAKPVPKN